MSEKPKSIIEKYTESIRKEYLKSKDIMHILDFCDGQQATQLETGYKEFIRTHGWDMERVWDAEKKEVMRPDKNKPTYERSEISLHDYLYHCMKAKRILYFRKEKIPVIYKFKKKDDNGKDMNVYETKEREISLISLLQKMCGAHYQGTKIYPTLKKEALWLAANDPREILQIMHLVAEHSRWFFHTTEEVKTVFSERPRRLLLRGEYFLSILKRFPYLLNTSSAKVEQALTYLKDFCTSTNTAPYTLLQENPNILKNAGKLQDMSLFLTEKLGNDIGSHVLKHYPEITHSSRERVQKTINLLTQNDQQYLLTLYPRIFYYNPDNLAPILKKIKAGDTSVFDKRDKYHWYESVLEKQPRAWISNDTGVFLVGGKAYYPESPDSINKKECILDAQYVEELQKHEEYIASVVNNRFFNVTAEHLLEALIGKEGVDYMKENYPQFARPDKRLHKYAIEGPDNHGKEKRDDKFTNFVFSKLPQRETKLGAKYPFIDRERESEPLLVFEMTQKHYKDDPQHMESDYEFLTDARTQKILHDLGKFAVERAEIVVWSIEILRLKDTNEELYKQLMYVYKQTKKEIQRQKKEDEINKKVAKENNIMQSNKFGVFHPLQRVSKIKERSKMAFLRKNENTHRIIYDIMVVAESIATFDVTFDNDFILKELLLDIDEFLIALENDSTVYEHEYLLSKLDFYTEREKKLGDDLPF